MGHKRVKMELIQKEKNRMLTFKKRKANLLKKASEFSILCSVSACVIIFPPKINDQPVKPETWPSDPNEVRSIIKRCKTSDQRMKNFRVSDYFSEKKRKIDSELAKLHKQVYKAKYPEWDSRLDYASDDQLRLLLAQLEVKMENVDRRISMKKERMHMEDNVGPTAQAVAVDYKLCGHNLSYDLEEHFLKRGSTNLCTNELQLVSNPKPLDVHLAAIRCLKPEGNSQLGVMNQNLQESNDNENNIGCSASLLSPPKPFNFPLPLSFQPKQDVSMKMWNNQSYNDSPFGVRDGSNSNSPFVSLGGLPYGYNSEAWLWDNVMPNGAYSSMGYVSPMLQPFQSHPQFPMSNFPNYQKYPQISEFNADVDSEGKDQNKF